MVLARRWPRCCLLARYQRCRGSARNHGGSAIGQATPRRSRVHRDRSVVASSVAPGWFRTPAIARRQRMPAINLPFILSVVGAFLTSSVIAYIYVWPALHALPRFEALRLLAAFHGFRFFGMNFLVAGFVSPELNLNFASQVGWGDLIA